jgi:hypothetical protein
MGNRFSNLIQYEYITEIIELPIINERNSYTTIDEYIYINIEIKCQLDKSGVTIFYFNNNQHYINIINNLEKGIIYSFMYHNDNDNRKIIDSINNKPNFKVKNYRFKYIEKKDNNIYHILISNYKSYKNNLKPIVLRRDHKDFFNLYNKLNKDSIYKFTYIHNKLFQDRNDRENKKLINIEDQQKRKFKTPVIVKGLLEIKNEYIEYDAYLEVVLEGHNTMYRYLILNHFKDQFIVNEKYYQIQFIELDRIFNQIVSVDTKPKSGYENIK